MKIAYPEFSRPLMYGFDSPTPSKLGTGTGSTSYLAAYSCLILLTASGFDQDAVTIKAHAPSTSNDGFNALDGNKMAKCVSLFR